VTAATRFGRFASLDEEVEEEEAECEEEDP